MTEVSPRGIISSYFVKSTYLYRIYRDLFFHSYKIDSSIKINWEIDRNNKKEKFGFHEKFTEWFWLLGIVSST